MFHRSLAAPRSTSTQIRAGLNRIALWQLATFVLLTLLVWVSEITDLPQLLFHQATTQSSVSRGAILTVAILFTAILTIGNTYLRGQRLMEEILVICARCGKVKLNADRWQTWEAFVADKSGCRLSHGLCPDCYAQDRRTVEAKPR